MSKKLIPPLTLLFLVNIQFSCDPGSACGDLPPAKDFNIKEMKSATVLIGNRNSIDTSQYYDQDSIATSIYLSKMETALAYPQQSGFSIISKAIACSPDKPESKQRINSVTIIATDSVLLPGTSYKYIEMGDTLNLKFKMSDNASFAFPTSIATYISSRYGYHAEKAFYFTFNAEDIPFPMHVKYNVKLTLSDGQAYSFPNEELKIR